MLVFGYIYITPLKIIAEFPEQLVIIIDQFHLAYAKYLQLFFSIKEIFQVVYTCSEGKRILCTVFAESSCLMLHDTL